MRHGDRSERPEHEIEREAEQHSAREPPHAARAAKRSPLRERHRAVRKGLEPRSRNGSRTRARARRVQRRRERGGGGRRRGAEDAGHVRARAALRMGLRAGRVGGGRARNRGTHVDQEACGLEAPRVYASNYAIVVSIHRTRGILHLFEQTQGNLSRTLQYMSILYS